MSFAVLGTVEGPKLVELGYITGLCCGGQSDLKLREVAPGWSCLERLEQTVWYDSFKEPFHVSAGRVDGHREALTSLRSRSWVPNTVGRECSELTPRVPASLLACGEKQFLNCPSLLATKQGTVL